MGLTAFNIASLLPYVAVSHRWEQHAPSSALRMNHLRINTTRNIKACLERLGQRLDPRRPRYIWIDSICVNQQDLQERSKQVALMSTIYRTATYVAIWLGESDESSKLAIRSLRLAAHSQNSVMTANRLCDEIIPLLRKEYFTRLWIVQEILLASKLVLMTGDQEVRWAELTEVIRNLCELSLPRSPAHSPSHRIAGSAVVTLIHARHANGRSMKEQVDPADVLFDILRRHATAGCSDVRDKVFGLLSIEHMGGRVGLRAEYAISSQELLLRILTTTQNSRRRSRLMAESAFLQSLLNVEACSEDYQQWLRARVRISCGIRLILHCERTDIIGLPLCSITGSKTSTIVSIPTQVSTYDAIASLARTLVTEGVISSGIDKLTTLSLSARRLRRLLVSRPTTSSFATDHELARTVAEERWKRRTDRGPFSAASVSGLPLLFVDSSGGLPVIFVDSRGNLGLACPNASEGDIVCDLSCINAGVPVSVVLRKLTLHGGYRVIGRALHGAELDAVMRWMDEKGSAEMAESPAPSSSAIPSATGNECFLYLDYPTMLALSTPITRSG